MVLTYSHIGSRKQIDGVLRSISDVMQKSVEHGNPFQRGGQAYPAAIVGCHKCGEVYWIVDSARSPVNYPFVAELRKALQQLGTIGEKSALCDSIIGQCAEPHAANEILNAESCSLNDLEFSLAMRPRTQTFLPYCNNCKKIFNL